MTYKSAPGAAGLQLVPDLATSLGTVSDHGLAWTYHLKPGIKFEDGSTVTSQDVKYAVERSYAKDVLPGGPSYFTLLLNDPAYPGPYKDKTPGRMGLTSITTPDAATIVFHLQRPFSDFDYVAALPQTVPVPPAKDTGANYQLHPVSTGPYMFASYQLNKQFTLVKNPLLGPGHRPQPQTTRRHDGVQPQRPPGHDRRQPHAQLRAGGPGPGSVCRRPRGHRSWPARG